MIIADFINLEQRWLSDYIKMNNEVILVEVFLEKKQSNGVNPREHLKNIWMKRGESRKWVDCRKNL